MNASAAEQLQAILEQLQQLCKRGEGLARVSGLVDGKWFRGAHAVLTMAAGEMDQKHLLQPHKAPIGEEVG